ncbi:MAG TPA: transcription repressor NadR [Candidatus Merdibacter merdigallinarum]|nr:transcription repressor NadR [Candidatus Merdibacter merdigallinarum]
MDRKAAIIEAIRTSETPVSASALARKLHVSRQIIVGDIALIRASGTQIIATPRGYVWERSNAGSERKIAVMHAPQQMREELYTIVDQGAEVVDVIVEHPTYGQLVGQLQLSSRYDVDQFIDRMQGNEPLSQLTHGVHLHTIRCRDAAVFERVENALRKKGLLYEEPKRSSDQG